MTDLAAVEVKLGLFLKANPASSIGEAPDNVGMFRVNKPWNDDSVAIEFSIGDLDEVAEAIQQVMLPERLSAIYHSDIKSLEVIWTAFRLQKPQSEVAIRKFNFKFSNKSYACHFGTSSERLLKIAKFIKPIAVSDTAYRNIQSFSAFSKLPPGEKVPASFDVPRSFWISNFPAKENDMILIVQNLNFFMTYYDSQSPFVVIHSPKIPEMKSAQKTRYIESKFPTSISGTNIDDTLLSFWHSAHAENNMMAFLLYYRIIEYVAVHYVDEVAKKTIKKALASPTAANNIDKTLDIITSALSASKLVDAQKLQQIMRNIVDPALAWREIGANLEFFSKDTKFEGGFTAKALVTAKDTIETYNSSRLETLADAFRKIRNALSHGKDQETAGVIKPTATNLRLLRPWVHLIETVAGEVVLYKGITI